MLSRGVLLAECLVKNSTPKVKIFFSTKTKISVKRKFKKKKKIDKLFK